MEAGRGKYGPLVGSIDEGTSSTRFMVFAAKTTKVLTSHQLPIPHITPQEGWVEQDPVLIMQSVLDTINTSCRNLEQLNVSPNDIFAIGITNQRETTVLWDRKTGKPLYNALVWLDMRTSTTIDVLLQGEKRNKNFLKSLCGLPVSTYFSAVKIKWLMDNVPEVKKAISEKRCMFGTIDSWLIWNLTGGVRGGIHVTDVTNASRTMLMNINTLTWDSNLCQVFDIPLEILPQIRSSAEIYGYMAMSRLRGIPISGCLGDQHAALVGQLCFHPGQAKCTYGTGCFVVFNTGPSLIQSQSGLLTTMGYQLGADAEPIYALEGSIAIAGVAIKWLRDNLGIVKNSADSMAMALEADMDREGEVYFVPAFSGLYAPYWRKDARSVICGITESTKPHHIVKAALEAVAFQVRDILDAMEMDCGYPLKKLLVDGGMTENDYLLQVQADYCGIPVVRVAMAETTALGAAMAAGCASGVEVWNLNNVNMRKPTIFRPNITFFDRNYKFARWKMAVARTFNWAGEGDDTEKGIPHLSDVMEFPRGSPGGRFYFSTAMIYVGVSFSFVIISRLIGGKTSFLLNANYFNYMD